MKDYKKFEELVENFKYNGLSEFQAELFSALMLGADNNNIKKIYNTLADSTIRNHKHILREKQKAAEIQYKLFQYLDKPIKSKREYCFYILKSNNVYKKLKMIPYISTIYNDIDLRPWKKEVENHAFQEKNYYLKFLALKAYSFMPEIDFLSLNKEFYKTKNDYIKYYILKIFYDKTIVDKNLLLYSFESNVKILIYAAYFIATKEKLDEFDKILKTIKKKTKELENIQSLEDIRKLIRKEIVRTKPTYVPLNTNLMDKRFDISEAERQKAIKSYFIGSKLKIIPSREKKKIIILQEILKNFENDKKYKREEVNKILKDIYEDYASLRRYLIEYGFMERTSDGRVYWIK
jgi:hypothetical protein